MERVPHQLTPEEQDVLNKKREAYTQAVGGHEGGLKEKIKEIIDVLRGGKFVKDSERLMLIDAHIEDDIRDEITNMEPRKDIKQKHKQSALNRLGETLENQQKSYLVRTDAIDNVRHMTVNVGIKGIINGQNIELRVVDRDRNGHDIAEGTIEGEKLSTADATEIYNQYVGTANSQTRAIERSKREEQSEKQKELETNTADMVEKLGQ